MLQSSEIFVVYGLLFPPNYILLAWSVLENTSSDSRVSVESLIVSLSLPRMLKMMKNRSSCNLVVKLDNLLDSVNYLEK